MFSLTPVALLIVAIYLLSSIKILAEYERGCNFSPRTGSADTKGPGLDPCLSAYRSYGAHFVASGNSGGAGARCSDPG